MLFKHNQEKVGSINELENGKINRKIPLSFFILHLQAKELRYFRPPGIQTTPLLRGGSDRLASQVANGVKLPLPLPWVGEAPKSPGFCQWSALNPPPLGRKPPRTKYPRT